MKMGENHFEEKKKALEPDSDMTQMLKLPGRDLK